MRTVEHKNYGPPHVLSIKETSKPILKANEILVKVKATTVNRSDCAILRAQPIIMRLMTGVFKPKLNTTGTDFSGVVVETGSEVKKFKAGDKLFGFNDNGLSSHAEFLAIGEDAPIHIVPESVTFEAAAASAEGFHYAYNMANKVSLQDGQKAFVNGGSGAIGSALIQILEYFKIEVWASASEEAIGKVQKLGAKKVLNYKSENFTRLSQKFDYVFDAVGKSHFSACKTILKGDGIYISSELGPGMENLYLPIWGKLYSKKRRKQRVLFPFPFNIKRSLAMAAELLEKKEFNPLIDKSFDLEQIVEAFVYAESGQKLGNIILYPVKHRGSQKTPLTT